MAKVSKNYPRSKAIQNAEFKGQEAFVIWDPSDKKSVTNAMTNMSQALEECKSISRSGRSTATFYQDMSDLDTNVSGRPGLSKQDYYQFRPGEQPAVKPIDRIIQADVAYRNVGIIRNIIDLMGDFACQGIRLVHPNKRVEKFYQNWFKKVKGKERSERFLNNLYRTANVIVRKQTAKLDGATQKKLHKSAGKPDITIEQKKFNLGEIPWKYTFLNPSSMEIVGGPLSSFVNQPIYAIKLPASLRRAISSPKGKNEKKIVSQLPNDLKQAAKTSQYYVLPQDKVSAWHYKKDDWQTWATPMTHAIMDDIMVLEKLKLADMAALDGAISNIRIFKLGNLENHIAPTRAAAAKFSAILENNVGGGTMDIVWGPDIEILESKTTVHQFLGEEKYKPHLHNLYSGLGIPPTLTGHFGGGGTTNNYISLKTLMQRLQYGRDVLTAFWTNEVLEVQRAMNFRFPASIEFDINVLGDEDAEKALLIQLADRMLISDELLQTRFQHDPILERIRINREQRERDGGKMVPKASPYHDPQFGIALKKIALQTGVVTPSQVGLRKEEVRKDLKMFEKEKGDSKPALLMRQPSPGQSQNSKPKGQPQQGRPKTSKDKQKRKERTFKPQNKAVLELWARATQMAISEVLTPEFLHMKNKKNLRSLAYDDVQILEKLKMDALFNLTPLGVVDNKTILTAVQQGSISNKLNSVYKDWMINIKQELDRSLTIDEIRDVQACLYVSVYGEEYEG